MPCDAVRLITSDLGTHTDPGILKKALEDLGYTVSQNNRRLSFGKKGEYNSNGSFANGKLTVPEGTDISAIKVAYSNRVVRTAAEKYGWAQSANKNSKIKQAKSSFLFRR